MRLQRWLAVALVLLLVAGCHGGSSPGKIIVVGLDGMDPEALDLLMSEGKMPNFAKLRQEGAYGRLLSSKPMLSPILWTTIATGKTPNEHHIGHFVAVNEKTGEQLPVTSQMRKVKALWNILSEGGRTVDVVGWWATWPAEDVRGAIVSDHTCYHFLFTEGATGAPDDTGLVYPPSLEKQIQPMIKRPGDITPQEAAPFVDVPASYFERPFSFEDEFSHFRWALATARDVQRHRQVPVAGTEPRRADGLHRGHRLDRPPVRPSLSRQGAGGRAGRAAEALRPHGRADVSVRRRHRRPVHEADGRQDHSGGSVGPRLQARRAAGGSEQAARHAARQRALPPDRGHPLHVRLPGEAAQPLQRAEAARHRPHPAHPAGPVPGTGHARARALRGARRQARAARGRQLRDRRARRRQQPGPLGRPRHPRAPARPRLPRHRLAEGRPQPGGRALPERALRRGGRRLQEAGRGEPEGRRVCAPAWRARSAPSAATTSRSPSSTSRSSWSRSTPRPTTTAASSTRSRASATRRSRPIGRRCATTRSTSPRSRR